MTPAQPSVGTMSWIDLEGAVNVRDVGGLPTVDDRSTRKGVLLRADNLQDLTPADVDRLTSELGVRTVLDRTNVRALEPEQVWILHRGPDGYTRATRTADLPGIPAMVEEGSPLGYLWSRNFFDVGNPLNLPAPIQ